MNEYNMRNLYSQDAEQSVLGAIMLDNECFDDIAGIVQPDSFYIQQNKAIYQAIQDMVASNQAVDVVTIAERLEGETLDYLVDLARNTPSTANVAHYAKIVAERKRVRDIYNSTLEVQQMVQSGESTPAQIIEQSAAMLAVTDEVAPSTQSTLNEAMEKALDSLDKRFHGEEDKGHIRSGLLKIDNRIMGFRPGNFVVVAARPGMGKTTYGMQIVKHAIMSGAKSMVFSLEMPDIELSNRLISSAGSVHMDFIRNPQKGDDQWSQLTNGVSALKDRPLVIDDQGGLGIQELCSRARREHRKGELKVILIDYIQLLSGGKAENRTQEVTNITKALKALAKELNCVIIAISQLNRSLEQRPNKRPVNSDLRESGSIEQDADIIQFIYRDKYYNEDSEMGNTSEIITSKFRDGQAGTDYVEFQGQFNRFIDCDFNPDHVTDERAGFKY